MHTLASIAGRLAVFILGHVVVLGLVIGLSMTAGQARSERGAGLAQADGAVATER